MAESLVESELEGTVMETIEQEVVTIKTLSHLIDTPAKTIRRWYLSGKMPYVKLQTGGVRFHMPTIRKWYKSGMVDTAA